MVKNKGLKNMAITVLTEYKLYYPILYYLL